MASDIMGPPTFDHAFIQIFGDYADDCTTENGSTATITASNKAGSVMFIHGNQRIEVVLKNLTLSDGNNTNLAGTGGGINFTGQGTLDTTNVTIFNNTATDGGGLFADGLGIGLTLKLRAGTVIDGNHARGGGGGMSVSGIVDLTPVENLLVEDNIADSDINNSGNGGGINFTGAQSWTLPNTTILANTAAFGGGISVTAGRLTLGANTVVENNTATGDGGGINVDGRGRLIAAKPQTLVFFNHAANGRGGGINISGARADIGSPGFGGVPVVSFNDALHGGGIAAVAGANPAAVRLFTTDTNQPGSISNNSAQLGGALYLQQFLATTTGGADAGFCAYNFRIDGNLAVDGSAIYGDTNIKNSQTNASHGQDLIFLNDDGTNFPPDGEGGFVCNPEPASNLGAVASCSPETACGEISGNSNVDSGGNATDGATIQLNNANSFALNALARFVSNRLRMQHNAGGRVINGTSGTISGNAHVELDTCLITNNNVTQELMSVEDLTINSCTLANDTIGADHVLHGGDILVVEDSILTEASLAVIDRVPRVFGVLSSLTQTNTLPAGANQFLVVADPLFVNSAGADYHLQPFSMALDRAAAITSSIELGNDVDLDGNPRAVDLPGVNDSLGKPRDLGAYELQSLPPGCRRADTIFCSGFEPQ